MKRYFILQPPPPPPIDNGGKPQINGKALWQTADHSEKPVCTFLPASPVGEQTRGEKLAGLLFLWQPLVKFFSPMSRPYTIKIGRGHTGNESKRLTTHRVLNSSAEWGHC
jgi:hypothetical protein